MKIVLTTYPAKPKELKQFVMTLLWKKLAKCVNQINYVKSYYWWKWKIEVSQEKLLMIKCNNEKIGEIQKIIKKLHPYDVPEIITLSPKQVNESYLNFINEK